MLHFSLHPSKDARTSLISFPGQSLPFLNPPVYIIFVSHSSISLVGILVIGGTVIDIICLGAGVVMGGGVVIGEGAFVVFLHEDVEYRC